MMMLGTKKIPCLQGIVVDGMNAVERTRTSTGEAHHPLKMACLPFHHNRMKYYNNEGKNMSHEGLEPSTP